MHPVLFQFGPVMIPTFGLLLALGLLAALFLSLRTAVPCGLAPDKLWNAGLFTMVAAFVCSRALLVVSNLRGFSEAPMLLLTVPSLTAGGLLLTVLTTGLYLLLRRMPPLQVMDAWAAPGLLLWACLALGHLAEGSDPGMPVARFGLKTSLAGYREQPVALYVAIAALLLAGLLFRSTLRSHQPGHIATLGLVLAGVTQFLLSFFRLPYLYTGPTPFGVLDPIQWAALLLVVLGGAAMVVSGLRAQTSPETRRQAASVDRPPAGTLLSTDDLVNER